VHLCGFTYCDRLAWDAERERRVIGDYGQRVTNTNADSDANSDTYTNAYSYGDAIGYTYSDADSDAWQSSRDSKRLTVAHKRGFECHLHDIG